MGFFRSFFGTCCGVEVFGALRKNSWLRTLGHLILLTLLCAVLIGVGNYYMLKYRWREAEAAFSDNFGSGIRFTRNGVLPEAAPERSRRQEFPRESLLIYVSPNGPETAYPDETLRDRNFILLWHPSCFLLVSRAGDLWSTVKFNSDFTMGGESALSYPEMKDRLLENIAQKPKNDWKWPEDYREMSSRRLFHQFRLAYSISVSMVCFLHQLLMTLICTAFFAGVFRLFSRRKLPHMTFGLVWKTAIYAAFPVIFVVSAFPALQLPGTHLYDQMFIAGWAIYMFFVLRYLALLRPETDGEADEERK